MTTALLAAMSLAFGQDELVYGEELAQGWVDASWSVAGGVVDYAAEGDAHTGTKSIRASLQRDGGVSFERGAGFGNASALRFFIKGQAPGIGLRLYSTTDDQYEQPIPVTNEWQEYVIPLDELEAVNWYRMAWYDSSESGATLFIDDVQLLEDDPNVIEYRGAEPLPPNRIVLYGPGDPDAVTVRLDGNELAIASVDIATGPNRTYLTLEAPLEEGVLEVETATGTFERTVIATSISVEDVVSHVIPDEVYGANFPNQPPSPEELARYGYGAIRWGGNARALYNPFLFTTNVGEDYFYLNVSVFPDLLVWHRRVEPVPTVVTVPNLDWVADGTQRWLYSVDKYGPQEEVAPINEDAGNGYDLDGNPITADPTDSCIPWTPEDAREWLDGMLFTPSMFAIGNETDIAHITHRAVHPDPATYDEQLQRFLDYANVVKDEFPNVPVSGPVGCCWFFYWNSGDPDDFATKGDFLPWFLSEVAKADAASGRRTLDVLDMHYYPENLIAKDWKNQSSPAIDAWRLRSTRSLWDPDHIDESYVGDSPPVTDQPLPDRVHLIPRLRGLIDEHYPGTKLSLSEWGFGDLGGISGGLAAADALGIFGRYEVDYAFMWPGPPPRSYGAAAFELYRGGGVEFGASSLPVTVSDLAHLGAYASLVDAETTALVLVNKSLDFDLQITVDGLEPGRLRVEHFGSLTGPRVVEHPAGDFEGVVTIPAYSAVMLEINVDEDPPVVVEPPGEDTGAPDGPVISGTPPATGSSRCGGCGTLDGVGTSWLALAGIAVVLRRRRTSRR